MSNLMTNISSKEVAKNPMMTHNRSIFGYNASRKMTMKASYLYPIFYRDTVPGDTWKIDMTHFMRLATQVTSPMDNLWACFYFFYTPDRLVWPNIKKQHGERENPDDTIDYITPTITSENGFEFKSIYDYMGGTQMGKKGTKISALPLRAYNLIWNEYFRSATIQDSVEVKKDDSDDNEEDYTLLKINKCHDYFTDMLPSITAGNEQVTIPLGTTAPLEQKTGQPAYAAVKIAQPNNNLTNTVGFVAGNHPATGVPIYAIGGNSQGTLDITGKTPHIINSDIINSLQVNLTNAVSAQLTAMRLAIDTMELLERDARTSPRYTSLMLARYGSFIPDLTLQRPQLIGAKQIPLFTTPVVQTSGTGTTGQSTPQGNIAGYGVSASNGRMFEVSCGEFGSIIGLCAVRTIPQYQQGIDRKWTKFERYDYYYPEFNAMSDQGVKRSELFLNDDDAVDQTTGEKLNDQIIGYIGRYDHLRYFNNEICGEFRSEYPQTMDSWHYAEKFENSPELNSQFIEDDTVDILKRSLAVQYNSDGTEKTDAEQLLCDFEFTGIVARGIPAKAIPKTGGNILS